MGCNVCEHCSNEISKELILDLLNGESGAKERMLNHFNAYIKTVSTFALYDSTMKMVSEDLEQEIRISLIKSIEPLRRNIIAKRENSSKSYIIIP